MHPGELAALGPDKPAYIIAESGETITRKQLDDHSMQASQLFRHLGLKRGDHIAILLENHPAMLQICLAAQRSGLYFTAISYRLQQEEVQYIVTDCQAKVFISSKSLANVVGELNLEHCHSFMVDGVVAGFDAWEEAVAEMPIEKISDESIGVSMLYSSGTTGRPKGVFKSLPEGDYGADDGPNLFSLLYGADWR